MRVVWQFEHQSSLFGLRLQAFSLRIGSSSFPRPTTQTFFWLTDLGWSWSNLRFLSCSNVCSSYQVYCMMPSHYTLDSDAACSTQCLIQTKQSRPRGCNPRGTNCRIPKWFQSVPWIGDGSKPWYRAVNPKIGGKWMFIPLKMVSIGIDPYPINFNLAVWVSKQGHRKDCVWSGSHFAFALVNQKGDLASQRHCQRATFLGTLV